MVRRSFSAAVAVLALGGLVVGCGTSPAAPAEPTAPAMIAGDGVYAYEVRLGSPTGALQAQDSFPHAASTDTVEFAYSNSGGTHTGSMVVTTDAGAFTHYGTFFTSGNDIVATYSNDTNVPGTGQELNDPTPQTSVEPASAACGGEDALVILTDGELFLDGVASGQYLSLTYKICDPVAAAWFG